MILFSQVQVGGVESVEVPEFVGVVDSSCGGKSSYVFEQDGQVWSVWNEVVGVGGVSNVVGNLNKSAVGSGSDPIEKVSTSKVPAVAEFTVQFIVTYLQ